VIALRYVYVLALSIWFGGTIIIGGVIDPASVQVLHRFFVISCTSGALLLTSLLAMALIGPRPSRFAWRLGIAVLMFTVTVYAGIALPTIPREVMLLVGLGGLALLFWEARDGTRAA
jgi:uncharacterized membrane protein